MSNVGKDVQKLDLSYAASGNVKQYCQSGKQLAVSFKIEYMLVYPSSPTCEHLFWRTEYLCPHKNQYVIVHSSFINGKGKTRYNQNVL